MISLKPRCLLERHQLFGDRYKKAWVRADRALLGASFGSSLLDPRGFRDTDLGATDRIHGSEETWGHSGASAPDQERLHCPPSYRPTDAAGRLPTQSMELTQPVAKKRWMAFARAVRIMRCRLTVTSGDAVQCSHREHAMSRHRPASEWASSRFAPDRRCFACSPRSYRIRRHAFRYDRSALHIRIWNNGRTAISHAAKYRTSRRHWPTSPEWPSSVGMPTTPRIGGRSNNCTASVCGSDAPSRWRPRHNGRTYGSASVPSMLCRIQAKPKSNRHLN